MAQPEEERLIRLEQLRSKQAIALAMQGRWREAVEVNQSILDDFPQNVDASNRLGRAYMELGEYPQAKEAYGRTLELDPYNAIAKKNIQRLSYLKEAIASEKKPEGDGVEPQHFIEEIGKSGVVSLTDLAPKETLARIVAGDKVYLKVEVPTLAVETGSGECLGMVGPRYSQRLIKLMEGGNRYSAAVVSSAEDAMSVIIREVYQDPGQAGRLSFPPKGLEEVRPYASDRVVKPEADYEDEGESGYTIIGGEEIEVLPEEAADSDEDKVNDEE
ncbi:MAG: tetratricopeptide repeat protein [Chloroflexota bacterium]